MPIVEAVSLLPEPSTTVIISFELIMLADYCLCCLNATFSSWACAADHGLSNQIDDADIIQFLKCEPESKPNYINWRNTISSVMVEQPLEEAHHVPPCVVHAKAPILIRNEERIKIAGLGPDIVQHDSGRLFIILAADDVLDLMPNYSGTWFK